MARATLVLLVCLVTALAALSNVRAAEIAGPRTTFAPASNARIDPYKNYRFRLVFDGRTVAGFDEVDGLDATVGVANYREGGAAGPVQKITGINKSSDVTLKRGVVKDDTGFQSWLNSIKGAQARKDIQIGLYDESGHLKASYLVHSARVSKIEAPDLNGKSNSVAVETLVLGNDGVELVPCTRCPDAASVGHGAPAFSSDATATFATNPQRFDPYKNFRFIVLMDGQVVAGASQMTGLDTATAGAGRGNPGPWQQEKLPGRLKWEPITLERGVTRDTSFENWAQGGRNSRKNIQIQIRDERGEVASSYTLQNAWVSEYQALPDLDAGAHAVAIEHIKLENEGWERDPVLPEPKQ